MVDVCPKNFLCHKLSLGVSPVTVKVAIMANEGKACSLHHFHCIYLTAHTFGLACDLTVEWQPPFLCLQPVFAALYPVVLGLLR